MHHYYQSEGEQTTPNEAQEHVGSLPEQHEPLQQNEDPDSESEPETEDTKSDELFSD